MSLRNLPILPLVAAFSAAALPGWGCASEEAARAAVQGVDGPAVRRGSFEDRFLLTGELQAVRSRQLTTPRTPTWNITIQWMEAEGTLVSVGDPVVQFDSSSVSSTLEDKRLALTEAEKELERTGIDLEVTRQQKALDVEHKKIATERAALDAAIPENLQPLRDYQDKQLALRKAEAELEKAQRELDAFEEGAASQMRVLTLQLAKVQRDFQRAESSLEELTLKAPVEGVLLHGSHPWEGRKWQVGDNTWPGTTVAEVPDLSAMEVSAWLSDVDDGAVIPGMPVRCILDTYPERSFAGRVQGVTEVAQEPDRDSSRRFFSVHVALDDIDPEIMRPGMSVKVEVIRGQWQDVAIVPRESLDLSGEAKMLRQEDGSTVEVVLLGCNTIECVLKEGPPEGTALEGSP